MNALLSSILLILSCVVYIAIATAAVEMLGGDDAVRMSRKPEIMADAAYLMLTQDSRSLTGKFCIDDEVLKEHGVTDMDQYANAPGEWDEMNREEQGSELQVGWPLSSVNSNSLNHGSKLLPLRYWN